MQLLGLEKMLRNSMLSQSVVALAQKKSFAVEATTCSKLTHIIMSEVDLSSELFSIATRLLAKTICKSTGDVITLNGDFSLEEYVMLLEYVDNQQYTNPVCKSFLSQAKVNISNFSSDDISKFST